jgi:hypothetical protein
VIGTRAVSVHGGQPIAQPGDLVVAAPATGQDLLELARGGGRLLVTGHARQAGAEGLLDDRAIARPLQDRLIHGADRIEPPPIDGLLGQDRAMHRVAPLDLGRDPRR